MSQDSDQQIKTVEQWRWTEMQGLELLPPDHDHDHSGRFIARELEESYIQLRKKGGNQQQTTNCPRSNHQSTRFISS